MEQFEKILKALADKNRLRIMKLLEKRPMCVCELAHILAITQPSVSRHLKKLKMVGFIYEEQDSFWTNYCLCKTDSIGVRQLVRNLSQGLDNHVIVREDARKARRINRKKLCRR